MAWGPDMYDRECVTWIALAASSLLAANAAAQEPCGGVEQPCEVEEGVYHVALPDGVENPPAVIYLHGYGGAGHKTLAKEAFVNQFTDRGYALILPTGQPDKAENPGLDWGALDNLILPRDDVAFLQDVRADALARFGLDPDRILIAGYSRGGSMVWEMACEAPDSARGFAALAGTFWEPMRATCAGPVDLHHTHGFTDRTLPLEGRVLPFAGMRFQPIDILTALRLMTGVNGCSQQANTSDTEGAFWVKSWTDCAAGSLTLALSPGGHGMPDGWANLILDWFETLE